MDACRHDLFEEVVGESDYRYSLGSNSSEFVEKNFSEGDWSDTVYVTANPHFHKTHFESLTGKKAEEVFHEVFHTYETDWNKDERTIMPEDVARDAETAANLFPDKKLIIHFMQPHYPFLNSDLEESGIRIVDGEGGKTIWERAERGEIDKREVRGAYKRNLEIVMEYVKDLNLEGTTRVTADHANLFGEGGIYGHPKEAHVKPLLRVPWYDLKAARAN
ncbi:MAG: hypothetical protein H8Z69_02645 [Nanohaloarchaea archaeon]|nr:hypothetical protein [Candidatus Nanohaloarchaea archaeon]